MHRGNILEHDLNLIAILNERIGIYTSCLETIERERNTRVLYFYLLITFITIFNRNTPINLKKEISKYRVIMLLLTS